MCLQELEREEVHGHGSVINKSLCPNGATLGGWREPSSKSKLWPAAHTETEQNLCEDQKNRSGGEKACAVT